MLRILAFSGVDGKAAGPSVESTRRIGPGGAGEAGEYGTGLIRRFDATDCLKGPLCKLSCRILGCHKRPLFVAAENP